MFDRIRQTFRRKAASGPADTPVSRWATSQFLHHKGGDSGQFMIEGQLQGRAFRAECGASSRPYIQGLELRARVDLNLPPAGQVVVMSRAVEKAIAELDTASEAYRSLVDEKRWLAQLPETQWRGASPKFWSRYSVRSDSSELAQRWLDNDALEFLTMGDSDVAAKVPVVIALMRGKCYLRLQANPHARDADTLLALELMEHLTERALKMAARNSRRH
ncbi:hypothetical protein [Hydrogenophaga sp. RWCD_12]|uniref:hypothetical protein n=1 Tax=Hydrogenophaga sp. RWCD_12 TaxID=3391190 RepID=UPI003984A01B